jgi:PDZ domain-containing secreted protein|tara:strand:- start:44 stop:298 length:255 start_codon:yes stop_codon:yes gene_type:complete
MDEITWTDGSKYERSQKEDNPKNKVNTETVYETAINKREHANNKMNEREMVKQVCDNPFFKKDSYIDIINKQEQFLIPKNSNNE